MGFLFVTSIEDGSAAIFMLSGGNMVPYEVADPMAQFTATLDTASMINVYWHAGDDTYYIQNKRGGERNLCVHLFLNRED
jgi:hypothetical protein